MGRWNKHTQAVIVVVIVHTRYKDIICYYNMSDKNSKLYDTEFYDCLEDEYLCSVLKQENCLEKESSSKNNQTNS